MRSICLSIYVLIGLVPFVNCFAEPISYANQIRPLLADYCIECHGPDVEHREADLRLDQKSDAAGNDDAVIVPFKPGESELVRRILSDDPDEMMPPKGDPVTAQEALLLKQWIKEGAKYDGWNDDLAKNLNEGIEGAAGE